MVFTDNNGAGTFGYRVWSVSGTTLTIPTAQANFPTTYFNGNGNLSPIAISSTEVVIASESSGAAQKLTISGTVVTQSTVWPGQGFLIVDQNNGANYTLSDTDFISCRDNSFLITRYTYNTSTGPVISGTSAYPINMRMNGYCKVTTNTGAFVGLVNNVPSGFIAYIT